VYIVILIIVSALTQKVHT